MTIALVLSLWIKSSLIALAGLVLNGRLKSHVARRRVFVLRLTLLALAVCVATVAAPPLIKWDWPTTAQASSFGAPETRTTLAVRLAPVVDGVLTANWSPPSPLTAGLLLAYGLVAAAIAAPIIIGVRLLDRWSREATRLDDGVWALTLHRLAPRNRVRLAASAAVRSPLSWGVAPSWVLLDPNTLRRPEHASSVLAHELAHIRSGDWAFQLLSGSLRALLWFNPLIWRLHVALGDAAEEAADDAAVEIVGRKRFAGALLQLSTDASLSSPAALALVGDRTGVAGRIRRLTARPIKPARSGFRRSTAGLAVLGAVFAVTGPAAQITVKSILETSPPATFEPASPPHPAHARGGDRVSQGQDGERTEASSTVKPSAFTAMQVPSGPENAAENVEIGSEQTDRIHAEADAVWRQASIARRAAEQARDAADRIHAEADVARAIADGARVERSLF